MNLFWRKLRHGVLTIAIVVLARNGLAQDQIRDFTRPFVVLDSGGHQAPVLSLVFAETGDRLLSTGMDKVVHVWDVAPGRASLARTIRPALWRGLAGSIHTMALSPVADDKGQHLLALGGFGLESSRGNITLMAYPGDPAIPNGEVVAVLPGFQRSKPDQAGHSNSITCLAFSPDGSLLASSGNDGRVVLWDVKTRKPIKVLIGPGPVVNVLAFRPDGLRLAAGGADGIVRLWDVNTRTLLAQVEPTNQERPRADRQFDARGLTILAMGFVPPRGDHLVVGRELGLLTRFTGDQLADSTILQDPANVRGPVEAIGFSHDGKVMAVSVVAQPLRDLADKPSLTSWVELREMPGGRLLPRRFEENNLIRAVAFSPDDHRLAYSGGDQQAVVIQDLVNENTPAIRLAGEGTSVWKVGFGPDSRSIGFSHSQGEGNAPEWIGFDFKGLALKDVVPENLSRALVSWNGWQVQPVDGLSLRLLGPAGKDLTVRLDPIRDRRWWAYSFLPPSELHKQPCLAVACDAGVVIFRLSDGLHTRTFSGHSSSVYDLAPSKDGLWLATASSDQTVKLWSLAGCDERPELGVTFERDAQNGLRVREVKNRGFGQAMGLDAGDSIMRLAVNGEEKPTTIDLKTLDSTEPGLPVEFLIKRGDEQFPVGTTRRDGPDLSLFVGEDREWVAWTPEGYYETSVAGDRKYLGWHQNGSTLDQPTDRFPADKFEKEFRKPDLISRIVDTASPAAVFTAMGLDNQDPAAIVQAQAPPKVTITSNAPRQEQRLEAGDQGVQIRAQVQAPATSPIASIQVLVDGQPSGPPQIFDPPRESVDETIEVPTHPGRQTVAVVAVNDKQKTRTEPVVVVSKAEMVKPPTLHVLAVGTTGPFADPSFPEIPFADDDARDLRSFFAAPAGQARYKNLGERPTLIGKDVTGPTLREALRDAESESYSPNDMLVVILESHMLTGLKDPYIVTSDYGPNPSTSEIPTATELAETLEKIASRGCKVMLLLDTSHEKSPEDCRKGLKDWVRSLSRKNIITFVAANHGVSRRVNSSGHGAFAQAILDVFDALGRSRPWVDPSQPMTLDDFQDAVVLRVKELTSRKQFAACYVPETISPQVWIFEPNRPQSLAESR